MIMRPFRPVIGFPLVAVGLGLTLVAVYLIASSGDKWLYMIVWGLGLSTMMLGLKFLPKKKQRREPTLAGRSPGCPHDNGRDCPPPKNKEPLPVNLASSFHQISVWGICPISSQKNG